METSVVQIEVPESCNVILGIAHFIKTVEDLYEALVSSIPNIKFGLAFCESSGPCLIRYEGTDTDLIEVAKRNAFSIGCGHTFIIYLKDAYPINILNRIKMVQEVCRILAATANPLQVIIVETEQGRGILGVVDGGKSLGIETEEDVKKRRTFLRDVGYKL
ncbi:adenosine-specific kinase [Candidatus Bathyarchaeota archaeon]|nr:adenosine-specific kinase [Candidatus Bathyarchaeota archaeon]